MQARAHTQACSTRRSHAKGGGRTLRRTRLQAFRQDVLPTPQQLALGAEDSTRSYTFTSLSSIDQVPAEEWDALVHAQPGGFNPFISHSFLQIMERSKSVGAREGWRPQHIILREASAVEGEEGRIVGAVPLYLKSHSYGEYVFDGSWARFAAMNGMPYYPKLQACVPFSPVPGPRLLACKEAQGDERLAVMQALGAALVKLAEAFDVSSVHVTFNTAEEAEALESCGWLKRIGMQFHWENDDYAEFEDYLLALRQSKRKSIKQERKSPMQQGLRVRRLTGEDLRDPDVWRRFYLFYQNTTDQHWGTPYLTPEFFQLLGQEMADHVLLVVAEEERKGEWVMVAGSMNLIGSEALYGRNWGCEPGREFKHLHFELCYYQALDEAIERGLPRVEAGAQGQHKLQRGYLPNLTFSSHFIRDPSFRAAVNKFLNAEKQEVASTCAALSMQASPYKKERTAELISSKIQGLADQVRGTMLQLALESMVSIDGEATEEEEKEAGQAGF